MKLLRGTVSCIEALNKLGANKVEADKLEADELEAEQCKASKSKDKDSKGKDKNEQQNDKKKTDYFAQYWHALRMSTSSVHEADSCFFLRMTEKIVNKIDQELGDEMTAMGKTKREELIDAAERAPAKSAQQDPAFIPFIWDLTGILARGLEADLALADGLTEDKDDKGKNTKRKDTKKKGTKKKKTKGKGTKNKK